MPRTIVFFLLFCLAVTVSRAQVSGTERFEYLISISDYQTLISELEFERSKNSVQFRSSNKSYLLARMYEKTGSFALAAANYNLAGTLDNGLEQYTAKHLSRLARASGNLALERLFLRELAFAPRHNLASVGAPRRLTANYYESEDFISAADLIENGLAYGEVVENEVFESREVESLLARCYLASGLDTKARPLFNRIIDTGPAPDQPDDFALEAARGLDQLDLGAGQDPGEVANLSAGEHKRRAEIYQFNRDFEHARLHLKAIVNGSGDGELKPWAMYQIGRGHAQERDDRAAVAWFERLRNTYPKNNLASPALYAAAGSLANLGEHDDAISRYSLYIDENPNARNLERAYLNIVDAYRDANDPARAMTWSRNAQTRFKGDVGEAIGLFAEAKILLASKEWSRAYSALNRLGELKRLGGSSIAGGTTFSEVLYLRGIVLEKLGKEEQSKAVFREIAEDWRDYYGWRAGDRLNTDRPTIAGKNRESKKNPAPSVRKSNNRRPGRSAIVQNPEFPAMRKVKLNVGKGVALSLLRLGLFDEAAPESEVAIRKSDEIAGYELSDIENDTAFTLAQMYANGGYADRAIRFIEPKWKKVPRAVSAEQLSNQHAVLLFPVPFRDSLRKHAARYDVDPRFLLSIMRQESRFQSDIKSAAAARGLMQFISGTSEKIANALEVENFDQNDLYYPDTAVRFGSKYVSNILRDFPGQLPAAAASYNAGEDRMARWMNRAKTKDPDIYVAEIVFSQTKDYTHKVMANYRMYTFLYDENLLPKNSYKQVEAE